MKNIPYKVCVKSITYNQADYITDTMNGFCMQETNFPYVCCIIDDASTDGEQDVILKYLRKNFNTNDTTTSYTSNTNYGELLFAQHRTNKNCYFAILLLKENHTKNKLGYKKNHYISEWLHNSPYTALCEGDDYWTDPLKLQKQFDFMESHPVFSLCHHNHTILKEGKMHERTERIPSEQDLLSIAHNNTVHTLTMFFRSIQEPLVPDDFNFKYPVYQFFINLRLAEYGKIGYINESMAVYRINKGGIWSQKDSWTQYIMSVGNLENMIDWYSQRVKRPDVVKIIKKRALKTSYNFIRGAIRRFALADIVKMTWHSIRFIR